jgi:hypothetical protein
VGSWLLADDDVREALVGKRIVAVDIYETFWDLTVEGGRRVRIAAAQPAIPEPVVEVWQHGDFMGS